MHGDSIDSTGRVLSVADWDRRLARLERRRRALLARSSAFSRRRIACFVITLLVTATSVVLGRAGIGWIALSAGAAVFTTLVVVHGRVEAARERLRLWTSLQERRRAALVLDWSALPPSPVEPGDDLHAFARDLDVVGPRSLLRLLDRTVASGSRARLRSWLLALDPDPAAARRRQDQVRALAPRRRARDRLAARALRALGPRAASWDTEHLAAWIGDRRDVTALRRALPVLGLLAALDVILVLGSLVRGWPAWWGLSIPVYFGGYVLLLRWLADLDERSERVEELLGPACEVFEELDGHRFAPSVEASLQPLRGEGAQRPSVLLRRARRVAWAASLRHNEILWLLLNVAVPWDVYFTLRLEDLREDLRHDLPRWLDAWHELEALSSLADFAERTARTCSPEFLEGDEERPVFAAHAIGHPLLRAEACVRNDLTVDGLGEVLLVSGSNMSGKSTFLRTLGLNVVLANAGSVVVADALRLRPLRVFTCLQVTDSVNDGISYFYAEVRRLAALLRALGSDAPWPQLSLVDEIYRGTNDRERWLGSRAFVVHLVGSRGVALLSTHDLRVTRLGDALPRLRNLHFREDVHDDRMSFDYLLREGPCPTTNALILMAREGLPVPDDFDLDSPEGSG